MKILQYVFTFLILTIFVSCETSIERREEPIRLDLKTNLIPPSLEHPAGGYSVTITIGKNNQTIYIWNGANGINGKDGKNGLDGVNGINGKDGVSVSVKTEIVAPDQVHPFGGVLIVITDAAGVHRTFVANGADGKNGLDGLNGLNGKDGKDGINGKDGISATVKTENIQACLDFPNGAIKFTIIDVNGIHISYVRNGIDGKNGLDGLNGRDGVDGINGKDGISATVKTENIPANIDFPYGAIKISVIDASGTHISYVRNGADGKNGLDGLNGLNGKDGKDGINGKDGISATIKTEDIVPCSDFPYGAIKITIIDISGTRISYVRNGADGKNGLDGLNGINGINGLNGVSVTVKTVKVDPCREHPTGGYYLTMTDVNGEHQIFISNGIDGVNGIDGTSGVSSYIYIETVVPTEYCQFGGYVIITGMDTNRNNVLDESEKKYTYFCNSNPTIPNENKVAICHKEEKSNGNDKNGYHTIYVPQSAVPAHIAHGDVMGECK